jgi:hypothetical protein
LKNCEEVKRQGSDSEGKEDEEMDEKFKGAGKLD